MPSQCSGTSVSRSRISNNNAGRGGERTGLASSSNQTDSWAAKKTRRTAHHRTGPRAPLAVFSAGAGRWRTFLAAVGQQPKVETPMPTATRREAPAAAPAKASGGTSAPSSRQLNPSRRTRSATTEMASVWCSPSGAPNTTVPLWPGPPEPGAQPGHQPGGRSDGQVLLGHGASGCARAPADVVDRADAAVEIALGRRVAGRQRLLEDPATLPSRRPLPGGSIGRSLRHIGPASGSAGPASRPAARGPSDECRRGRPGIDDPSGPHPSGREPTGRGHSGRPSCSGRRAPLPPA